MNEDLLNVMGSFSETALDCIEKQNEEIEDLKKENTRLKEERKQIKEYVKKCNFDNAEILYDFGSEYCYIDDFKEHMLEILKEN